MFGASTCPQPLASSRAAERKTASALQLPCQSSGCPNRDSDGNCTRLVTQNSELPVRKVTCSSFTFLLRSEIPNTRLKIPPCSHFPFIYFSSKALFTLLQLSSALVSWRKGPLALVFPWRQGCGWSPRSGWKRPEVCRDGAALTLCYGTLLLPTEQQSSPTSLVMSGVPKMIKDGAAPAFDEEEWNVTRQGGRARV